MAALVDPAFADAGVGTVRGLPFTRSYPLEEIGNVPRGARLGFDGFGRLAVIHYGFYTVLNDTVWLDRADRTRGDPGMPNFCQADDGRGYYCAMGSWGTVETTPEGKLRPRPLVPADPPKWVSASNFSDIVVTARGVYFAGWNGVVYWDFADQRNHFFEIPRVSKLFRLGAGVYVSAFNRPVQRIDGEADRLESMAGTDFGEMPIDQATHLDAARELVSTRDGRMLVFDGAGLAPWPGQARNDLAGRISALQSLVDGGVAVAVTGKGLFLISPAGELLTALTSSEYQRITSLATREPGVLWTAGENGVEKIFYGSPLTVFGQRLGLTLSWPVVARWRGQVLVASSGRLFEAIPGPPGAASRFEGVKNQPAEGVWTMAARGEQLLVGNAIGAYAVSADGRFVPVLTGIDVARLAMVGPDLCFVVGRAEIAVLRWQDGRWAECAARIPSPGFAPIVHSARHSAWLEFGGNKVARLSLQEGRLRSQVFEISAWKDAGWINVGIVDDTVVLSGPPGRRRFFDENAGAFRDVPWLRKLLGDSPVWILRVEKDESGRLWASHEQGVVTFEAHAGRYQAAAAAFDLNNDHFPRVEVLPGNDVWFATGQSLYHVERRAAGESPPALRPVLVSLVDGRTNAELLQTGAPLRLSYAQNDLSLRFFAGSYAWRRAPAYEFRLADGTKWRNLGTGSLLNFPGLREGSYQLEVRIADGRGRAGPPFPLAFEIRPPWHRTWQAYVLAVLTAGLGALGCTRWLVHRARQRTFALEKLVGERTEQLRTAMEKLEEETRNAATLAERDRLAGEIHDSLQQGLSGLMLQLDATLKMPALTGEIRSRLVVARNMVSFTRHEVQHAVWDMESSLLEDTELGEALRKITTLIGPGAAQVELSVSGPPVALPPALKHHLLRIAQEAITNAVRHAGATTIAIRLKYSPGAVTLRVADDGAGFKPDEVLAKSIGHFGLRGLRGRAGKVGGELHLESSPGGGTAIEIHVPLPEPAHLPVDAVTDSA